MMQLNMKEIPAGLLIPRWGRAAKESLDSRPQEMCPVSSSLMVSLHAIVYASAMELVGMCNTSVQAAEIGIECMKRAKQEIGSMAVEDVDIAGLHQSGHQATHPVVEEVIGPPRVRSRGRPKEKHLKPIMEIVKTKKKKSLKKAEKKTVAALVSTKRRSSRLAAANPGINHDSGPRKCSLCGAGGIIGRLVT